MIDLNELRKNFETLFERENAATYECWLRCQKREDFFWRFLNGYPVTITSEVPERK